MQIECKLQHKCNTNATPIWCHANTIQMRVQHICNAKGGGAPKNFYVTLCFIRNLSNLTQRDDILGLKVNPTCSPCNLKYGYPLPPVAQLYQSPLINTYHYEQLYPINLHLILYYQWLCLIGYLNKVNKNLFDVI